MNQDVIANYIQGLDTHASQRHYTLQVFPLVAERGHDSRRDFMSVDDALESKQLMVTEVDEHGEVNTLEARNLSDKFILILAGEELIGAKQNRIVNTTILLPPESIMMIPVSCVERDRWTWRRRDFATEKRMSPPRLRKRTSLSVNVSARSRGTFASDQSGIWEDLDECFCEADVSSGTSEMAEIYRQKQKELAAFLKAFTPVERQVGAIFAINGRIVGMDAFESHDTFSRFFQKIVQSYALDALLSMPDTTVYREAESYLPDFINNILNASTHTIDSVGRGQDVRIESETVAGHALVVDGEVFHLSLFNNMQHAA